MSELSSKQRPLVARFSHTCDSRMFNVKRGISFYLIHLIHLSVEVAPLSEDALSVVPDYWLGAREAIHLSYTSATGMRKISKGQWKRRIRRMCGKGIYGESEEAEQIANESYLFVEEL